MASAIAADGGSSVPTHSARARSGFRAARMLERRGPPGDQPAGQQIAQAITAATAARLASTQSNAAASATIQFNSVLRLITSSR